MAPRDGLNGPLERYVTLKKICDNARDRAKQNPQFVKETFDIRVVGKKVRNESEFLLEYFDRLQQQLFESFFIEVVATFEQIAFARASNTVGTIRKLVEKHYPAGDPFKMSASGFVKDTKDIGNLAALKAIVTNSIPSDLQERLAEIIKYRNRLAHGKRFGEETDLNIEDVVAILSDVLELVDVKNR